MFSSNEENKTVNAKLSKEEPAILQCDVEETGHKEAEEEEEEENHITKADEEKSAITSTEDDQKSFMDLGSSELERNQRLESLIARMAI